MWAWRSSRIILTAGVCSVGRHSDGRRTGRHGDVLEVFIDARVVAVIVRAQAVKIFRLFRERWWLGGIQEAFLH